ncbi:MAG: MBOAT family protein [Roseiarcus sp.]
MLFNSYPFLFAFLPAVVFIFFLVGWFNQSLAAGALAAASVLFYSWWSWRFTPILLISVTFNYLAAREIMKNLMTTRRNRARLLLIVSVALNLIALGYFKYTNFFVQVIQQSAGLVFDWQAILLPIGISFFTFTQIAYLVDTFQGKVGPMPPIHYLLFVTYFPHLIAGPILHHSEMMPQFRRWQTYRPSAEALSVGLTVFILGLVKKVFIADSLAGYANLAFAPDHVETLSTPEAWRGVLAYTLQIYFDFSAYCDMAIGISRMLNITLPANFESPYKAVSITDFWRRWHMTLSRFLRDYLYIPLGGNQRGQPRRYINLLTTMILGGLWHGACWTFLIWGLMHGLFLCVNHMWNAIVRHAGIGLKLPVMISWGLTFFAVMIAWVFFRAPDLHTALGMLRVMVGMGASSSSFNRARAAGVGSMLRWAGGGREQMAWLLACMVVVLTMPNLRQLMGRHELVLGTVQETSRHKWSMWSPTAIRWIPNASWAILAIGLFFFSLTRMNRISQFLYFQF